MEKPVAWLGRVSALVANFSQYFSEEDSVVDIFMQTPSGKIMFCYGATNRKPQNTRDILGATRDLGTNTGPSMKLIKVPSSGQ